MKFWRVDDNLEFEFLPAALEISETPPSPLGRLVIWLIFAIVFIAIIWACLGKIDEVAVARGKVIPDGRIKVVQPLEEGVVVAIHVNEGQRVKEGQLLIELDSALKKTNLSSLQKAYETASLENELLKKALAGNDIQQQIIKSQLPEDVRHNLLKWVQSRDAEYFAKRQSLSLLISQRESQLRITQSDFEKLENTLLMLKIKEEKLRAILNAGGIEESNLKKLAKTLEFQKEEEQKYKGLFEKGYVAKNDWTERLNEYVLSQKEYETQQSRVRQEKSDLELNWKNACDELELSQKEVQTQQIRIEEARSKFAEAKANFDNLEKERNTNTLNLIVEKDKKIAELEAELAKTNKSIQYQSLLSPVNGTIHGLMVTTIGGVVTPAQQLMNIVPEGTSPVIEAFLMNKDIGFVAIGQEVSVKLDTFPFQKYGTIKGKVKAISTDAFEDEKLGSIYKMKISLEKEVITVGKKNVPVSPGMAVTAEIKTGKRRMIEFFLDPIIKYAEESLTLR